tara:strand:- start:97 stop:1086 length:990 start_codon:yes stop_codon:yes gene_type:complete
MIYYLTTISFFLAIITSKFLVPYVIHFGNEFKILDKPDHRKKNTQKIVRFGGLVFIFSYLLSICMLIILNKYFLNIGINYNQILSFSFASLCFYLIGLFDDIFLISPFPRLILQFFVAFFCWLNGLRIDFLYLPFTPFENNLLYLSDALSIIFTLFWIVGVINAINWLDGLDGLAIGFSLVVFASILLLSITSGNIFASISASSLIGSSVIFYFYNKYPAKLMMGDGGSYFLGFTLACFSLSVSKFFLYEEGIYFLKAHIPILLLSVPLLDMVCVIVRRILKQKSPFFPDRNHFHYLLIDSGIGYKQTVRIIYLLSIFTSIIAISSKNL